MLSLLTATQRLITLNRCLYLGVLFLLYCIEKQDHWQQVGQTHTLLFLRISLRMSRSRLEYLLNILGNFQLMVRMFNFSRILARSGSSTVAVVVTLVAMRRGRCLGSSKCLSSTSVSSTFFKDQLWMLIRCFLPSLATVFMRLRCEPSSIPYLPNTSMNRSAFSMRVSYSLAGTLPALTEDRFRIDAITVISSFPFSISSCRVTVCPSKTSLVFELEIFSEFSISSLFYCVGCSKSLRKSTLFLTDLSSSLVRIVVCGVSPSDWSPRFACLAISTELDRTSCSNCPLAASFPLPRLPSQSKTIFCPFAGRGFCLRVSVSGCASLSRSAYLWCLSRLMQSLSATGSPSLGRSWGSQRVSDLQAGTSGFSVGSLSLDFALEFFLDGLPMVLLTTPWGIAVSSCVTGISESSLRGNASASILKVS